MTAQADQIQRTITDEFFRIAGFDPRGLARRILGPILWLPTRRFASWAVGLDNDIEQYGMTQAAHRYLDRHTKGFEVSGAENIPPEGPLIIASNHPGLFDVFTIFANIPRDDVKFIISGVPVVRSLPAASRYLIYTTPDPHGRMNVVRASIQHVKEDGCLFILPTGIIDPDPELLPGAEGALGNWSPSLEIILRRAPQTRIQVAIVSGVVPEAALRHPLTYLVKEDWKKRRLAEFLIVAQNLMSNRIYDVTPKVSFGIPFTRDDLQAGDSKSIMDGIIEKAGVQLAAHKRIFPCYDGE